MILQRELRSHEKATEDAKKELDAQMMEAAKAKTDYEELILSLREDLALTEVQAAKTFAACF